MIRLCVMLVSDLNSPMNVILIAKKPIMNVCEYIRMLNSLPCLAMPCHAMPCDWRRESVSFVYKYRFCIFTNIEMVWNENKVLMVSMECHIHTHTLTLDTHIHSVTRSIQTNKQKHTTRTHLLNKCFATHLQPVCVCWSII